MDLLKEYGPTITAAGIGAFLGMAALGAVLYFGKENDIGVAEVIRDGLGG